MNPDDVFTIMRYARTPGVKLDSVYSQAGIAETTPDMVAESMLSKKNTSLLAQAVFDKADPLRNSGAAYSFVMTKVEEFLLAWKQLGKFDKLKNHRGDDIASVSMASIVHAFNKEFVDTFSNKIIQYDDPTKVHSITDPSGMFAQQTHTLLTTGKQIPFYERAIYKRLVDKNLDIRQDETETPFYKMDHNPRLTDAERIKTKKTSEADPSIDRLGMSFRMLPRY